MDGMTSFHLILGAMVNIEGIAILVLALMGKLINFQASYSMDLVSPVKRTWHSITSLITHSSYNASAMISQLNRLWFRVALGLGAAILPLVAIAPPPAFSRPPRLDEFSESGGCQLVVHPAGIIYSDNRVLLHGDADGGRFGMSIDGRRIFLNRVGQRQGSNRPGGRTTDQLISDDGTIQVRLVANWRQGIEGVEIYSGTLRVTRNGETTRVNISGYDGC